VARNKCFIKLLLISVFSFIFSGLQAFGQASCERWGQPSLDLSGKLCVTVRPADDDVPLYRQELDGVTYRFHFDDQGLALAVSAAELNQLKANPAQQAKLLSQLNASRLQLWHLDALYWAKWLGNFQP
jgi:hypothetical protein